MASKIGLEARIRKNLVNMDVILHGVPIDERLIVGGA